MDSWIFVLLPGEVILRRQQNNCMKLSSSDDSNNWTGLSGLCFSVHFLPCPRHGFSPGYGLSFRQIFLVAIVLWRQCACTTYTLTLFIWIHLRASQTFRILHPYLRKMSPFNWCTGQCFSNLSSSKSEDSLQIWSVTAVLTQQGGN